MFLRGIDSNTIDLIATDPPFNKGRDFHATPDSLADGASFQDRWSWEDDVEGEWTDKLEDDFPDVYHVVQGSRKSYGDDMGAFLCFMAVRLLEMKRVLKPTGSIYLHCDPTASHYLKELMDAVFGKKNFRNEIIWHYSAGHSPRDRFKKKHDVILFYAKSKKSLFTRPHMPYAEKDLYRFNLTDEDGRKYRINHIKDKNGEYKRFYWDDGTPCDDVWTYTRDGFNQIGSTSKERTGYPTQKPIELYKRIIEASSNEGGTVLDPFCGCATTLIAAEKTNRQWIGIDLWDEAHRVVWGRLKDEWIETPEGEKKGLGILEADKVINYQKKPPIRTDDGEEAVPFMKDKQKYDEPKEARKSRDQIFKELVDQNRTDKGIKCVGCNRFFNDERYFHLDHNTPRSQGGINHISNRMLLCGPCNGLKGDTRTLKGLQNYNKELGRMA